MVTFEISFVLATLEAIINETTHALSLLAVSLSQNRTSV